MGQTIIDRWIAGDDAAGEALYRGYFERLQSYLRTRGLKDPDAEDAAQEALIRGLQSLKQGGRPDDLTGWLKGIAKHVASSQTRLCLSDRLEPGDVKTRSARTQAVRAEMRDLLQRSIDGLPKGDREVVELAHHAGLSRKEIADKLDLPLQAVHSRFARAEARLRGALEKHFTTVALRTLKPARPTAADVRSLRPMFREAVVKRHLEDRSEAAAAEALRIPVATLRARLQSAYELLGFREAPDFSDARREWTAT